MSEIFAAYSSKLINSFVLTLLFLTVYGLLLFFMSQKVSDKKRYYQSKIRLRYLLIAFFMLCFIKIWVEGFIQIVAFIGFISAAVTITQKDNLMNLIGWLIINWRDLFHEGDYIKIANNAGFVKSIGFMYFTLQEASIEFPSLTTGRIIKVPNGLVARNPLTNFSHETFIESTVSFIFKPTASFELLERLYMSLKMQILHYAEQVNKNEEFHGKRQDFTPKHVIKIRQEKPAGFEFVLMFYSKHQDKTDVLFQINKAVIAFTQNHPELVIAFD